MDKRIIKCITLVALLGITSVTYTEYPWKLSQEVEGIQVFVRDTPGSAVKSFKGVMAIPTRLTSLVAVLEDTQSFTRWLHQCKSARTLKEMGKNESLNYIVTEMPWPVTNRDTIVHSIQTQNKKNKQVEFKLKATPDYLLPERSMVRIKNMKGRWLFTPQKKGLIRVDYEMSLDPGGKIPKWLVNSMVVDLPFNTLKKLREMVKEAAYKNAERDYIQE